MRLILIGVTLLTFSAAQKAEAQGFIINPFFTTTLTSPSGGGHTKPGVGVAVGTNRKILSLETEIAYHPQIIDTALDGSKSKVLTFSGDMLPPWACTMARVWNRPMPSPFFLVL